MNVGIDLGTTNSALAYIDPREAARHGIPALRALSIRQRVGEDAVADVRVLPSFLYLGEREEIGVYAREQGAVVPTRLIHSAKSWLAAPEVDRTARILPWDSDEVGRVLSPVDVTARFLAALRDAWEEHLGTPLAAQAVVLTVPASFDAEARQLTVQAARDVGLERLTLLEEPAAAFYAWIAHHLDEARAHLRDGHVVLVIDVGGGTSDFTMIRVARAGDDIGFTRTAVGRHLLLGGDNLDLALAWRVEHKLGTSLSVRQRHAVRRQCSAAKERLLSDAGVERVDVTIIGSGTSVVGGVRRAELRRDEVLEAALEGFLPPCGLDERPKEDRRTLFRELGLPYVADPAITRHLAAFLSGAAGYAPDGVDAILFNGGFFVPAVFRERVTEIVERWYGRRPRVLANDDLDLAVAVGAAYYSFTRVTGQGVVVRGGLPRAYYIGLGAVAPRGSERPDAERARAVCLVPRGTTEGVTLELDLEGLQLLANRPVSFRLYSSLTRADDALGAMIDLPSPDADTDLHLHAPLQAVMRFGKRATPRLVPVTLGAQLTEIGTLEIWCLSKISEHRWRLEFALRPPREEAAALRPATAVVTDDALAQAAVLIREVFGQGGAGAPDTLPGRLEQTLGLGKVSWPLGLLRSLGDLLLEHAQGRGASAAHEVRWLNLAGFCLRPGFGAPGDPYRIEQIRRVYLAGLVHPDRVENEVQWWILWGRVAGGLNGNQQGELLRRLSPALLSPSGKRVRGNPTLRREMWRAASSLERVPEESKVRLGDALASAIAADRAGESDVWCLMRLGARRLLYGPANQVVPPACAERWVEALLSAYDAMRARHRTGEPPLSVDKTTEALVALARRTGDATRDVSVPTMDRVRRAIATHRDAERLTAILDGQQDLDTGGIDRMFGEQLPSGLITADVDA